MPWILASGRVASGFILRRYWLIGRPVAMLLCRQKSLVAVRRAAGDSSAGCAAFDNGDPPSHYYLCERPASPIPACFRHSSCPRSGISRRHAESPEGTGIRCMRSLGILFFLKMHDCRDPCACIISNQNVVNIIIGCGKKLNGPLAILQKCSSEYFLLLLS